MNHLARALTTALLLATSIVASLPSPVAAAMPDGAYARFNFGGGHGGLVFLSYTGTTTVNAGVVGLVSSSEYFLWGSTQSCNHSLGSANKAFRIKGMTDEGGALWMRRSPSLELEIHSLWLGPTNSSEPPVCRLSLNFDKYKTNLAGDWDGDAILGIWDKEHVLSLLVRRPNDQARFDVVIDTGSGDDHVNLRGVDRRCGTRPAQRFFDVFVDLSGFGLFDTEMLSLDALELGGIRSMRAVFDGHHECANIIGILIG